MSGIFRDAEPTIILYGLRYRDLIEGDFDDLSFPMEDIQLEDSIAIETKPIINEDDALFLIYTSARPANPKVSFIRIRWHFGIASIPQLV
jgi:hypothetical protein